MPISPKQQSRRIDGEPAAMNRQFDANPALIHQKMMVEDGASVPMQPLTHGHDEIACYLFERGADVTGPALC